MTKKFWKFVTEDGCSPGKFGKIKYIPGETIEVEDADPDKSIQCSSGIHCLDFSNEQYDDHNIVFGPKVAILEVDEENIIYYEKNGKCRVKKAKVLEVKEPELWMRTGNGNISWILGCGGYCGHHPDIMQLIIDEKNSQFAYWYALEVLKGHDERLMQVIIDGVSAEPAYCYAHDVLKGHDEKLMQVILDGKNARYAYYYAKSILKKHDERLMNVVIDGQDHYSAFFYANDVLKGHDERLMQVIIDQKDARYAYYYALDILKKHNEKLMEIANNDSFYKDLYEGNVIKKEKQND